MSTIYLIRHGQASFGSADYDRLSPLGRRQAEVTGQYFKTCDIHWDAIYSGNLKRQVATARLAAISQEVKLTPRIDSRFNEIRNEEQIEHLVPELVRTNHAVARLVAGGLKSSKDYQKVIDAVFNYWVSDAYEYRNIQSWEDYAAGVRAGLEDVMAEQGAGKSVAIFTSGGTIATMVAQVLGLPAEKTYQLYEPVINCSVTRLFYNANKVSLSYFNDHSFLDVIGRRRHEALVTYR